MHCYQIITIFNKNNKIIIDVDNYYHKIIIFYLLKIKENLIVFF